jgi:hypothetical protein
MFYTHLTQEKEQIFELVFANARLINDEVAENSPKMFVLFG